jgi:hypothetical protein
MCLGGFLEGWTLWSPYLANAGFSATPPPATPGRQLGLAIPPNIPRSYTRRTPDELTRSKYTHTQRCAACRSLEGILRPASKIKTRYLIVILLRLDLNLLQ